MKLISAERVLVVCYLISRTFPLCGQEKSVSQYTNFYYFGPIKEQFSAYIGSDGKLVKHGKYRDWKEDGWLWHEIDYSDGRPHGLMTTFYPNGRKASKTMHALGKLHGLSTTWNREGAVIAQGTNYHGKNWNGTFANERRHSIRSPGDEDILFYVSQYKDGALVEGKPKEIFDDGTKWKPPPSPVSYRRLLRWVRYSYEIDSAYPYLERLPAWSEIPILMEWICSDRPDAGVDVAYSQLVALSRADFGQPNRPSAGGLPPETLHYHKSARSQQWLNWWESVGKLYVKRLEHGGRQNAKAWSLVTRDNPQPLPEYKVTIPDAWVLKTAYRAGDYGGIQTEALTLRRTKEKATLIRALRKSTEGPLEWERWQPLTMEEADNVAFAVAYAIDHPWLLRPKNQEASVRELEGRNLTLYYPYFRYAFEDEEGNVWWNDDPWHWYGAKDEMGNFMGSPNLGSVCLLIWRTFPDNSPTKTAAPVSGGWRPLNIPGLEVLQHLTDDLKIRGEFIEAVQRDDRMQIALETLKQYGTPEQLPAINRFRSDIATHLEAVAPILAQDPNGENRQWQADRLMGMAAQAIAAIQKRSGAPK